MNNISFYLEKYANFGQKEDQTKKILITSIKEACGVELKKEQIDIKERTFTLNIQGPGKSEILINLERIQKAFKERIENLGYRIDQRKII